LGYLILVRRQTTAGEVINVSKGKWGESFLKSGLPLEHLTLMTLRSLDWSYFTYIEYSRPNREAQEAWFEVDLAATCPTENGSTELCLVIECKYHDMSRFWFFLPHERYRWHFNDRVLNCGPLQTLAKPQSSPLLDLAPTSLWGIVVSEDGTKQDNIIHTAIQQLANALVPYSLMTSFYYNLDFTNVDNPSTFVPWVTAIVPVIVTNAKIYRLKPNVSDLDVIRAAGSPDEIADEIGWTWCYFEPPTPLIRQNVEAIEAHKHDAKELVYRFPFIEERLNAFANRPNWLAVINIRSLPDAVLSLVQHFQSLQMRTVEKLLGRRSRRRHKEATP
jgi:hypothetical protein